MILAEQDTSQKNSDFNQRQWNYCISADVPCGGINISADQSWPDEEFLFSFFGQCEQKKRVENAETL